MTSQSSGGSGSGLPGVTTDGLTPGGIHVAGEETVVGAITGASLTAGNITGTGALTAGNPTAVAVPSYINLYGGLVFHDVPANQIDGDDTLLVLQSQPLVGDDFNSALYALRSGTLNGHDHTHAVARFEDSTASTAPVVQATKGGTVVLEINTQQSITGALASVTDANAKAVLTSIIAALTGIKVATNNTT